MCGIVGYIGRRNAAAIVLAGLKRLEYRGYDSFGVATLDNSIHVEKRAGRIGAISNLQGNIAIGHTRWATHGQPTDVNAHPHIDCQNRIAIVHNGIIENYVELKVRLIQQGHTFRSTTDSEVIAHLIEDVYDGDLLEAVRSVTTQLKGSYALLVIAIGSQEIVIARKASPLAVGIGINEMFIGSDALPMMEYTNKIVYLEDGDIARVYELGLEVYNKDELVIRNPVRIVWSFDDTSLGLFEHYMLKEIYEQPRVYVNAINAKIDLPLTENINVIGCGSSYYAGLAFKYLCEDICKLPVSVYHGSEFRYFPPPIKGTVIGISQSGETADTLVAIQHAPKQNSVAITNVENSSITRIVDNVILMNAGPEIAVAATKSFISQLGILLQIINSIQDGEFDETLDTGFIVIEQALNVDLSSAVELCKRATSMFYMGRGAFYPIVLEGALKMKEIAYIHAEGFPAGELKHGSIALVSSETPVVAVCMPGETYEVTLSNIKEMQARGAPVIVIGEVDDVGVMMATPYPVLLPKTHPLLRVITVTVALQLLAYYTAVALDRDVDKPRNLAKSVTVE